MFETWPQGSQDYTPIMRLTMIVSRVRSNVGQMTTALSEALGGRRGIRGPKGCALSSRDNTTAAKHQQQSPGASDRSIHMHD